jgi:hypothetical protein
MFVVGNDIKMKMEMMKLRKMLMRILDSGAKSPFYNILRDGEEAIAAGLPGSSSSPSSGLGEETCRTLTENE